MDSDPLRSTLAALVDGLGPLERLREWAAARCGEARGQHDPATGERATAVIHFSQVVQALEVGLFVVGADVTVSDTLVSDVAASSHDGLFGDGIVAAAVGQSTSLVLERLLVQHNERAGVVSFGSQVSLAGTSLKCNALDLVSETDHGFDPVITDLGGNVCGCDQDAECTAASAGLEPPEPLDPS